MLNRDHELVPTIGDHGFPRVLRLVLQILAVIWSVFPTRFSVMFCVAGILLGAIVGGMAVILPIQDLFAPLSLTGIVVILTFLTFPEMRKVPIRAVIPTFFAFVIVEMTLPNYLAITAPGLPFVSIIRVFFIATASPFLISIAGSSDVRHRIKTALSSDKPMCYAIFGLFIAFALSIPTSVNHLTSIKYFLNIVIMWMLPFLLCVFVVDTEERQERFLRVLVLCAIFAVGLSSIEYFAHQRLFAHLVPQSVFDKDPTFAMSLFGTEFRGGRYRAEAHFTEPLDFSEYCSLILPIALYFIVYCRNMLDRIIGLSGALAMLFGLYFANSRGGVAGAIIGTAVFVLLFIIKAAIRRKSSFIGLILAATLPVTFSIIPAMMLLSHRFAIQITGGGEGALSNQARFNQWHMAWPHIISRPLTGSGIGNAADVVGYISTATLTLDSYPLTLLVDSGVLGLTAFYAIFGILLWRSVKLYPRDMSPTSDKAIALVSAFAAFLIQLPALSQTENFTNIFMLIGVFIALENIHRRQIKFMPSISPAPTNSFG